MPPPIGTMLKNEVWERGSFPMFKDRGRGRYSDPGCLLLNSTPASWQQADAFVDFAGLRSDASRVRQGRSTDPGHDLCFVGGVLARMVK